MKESYNYTPKELLYRILVNITNILIGIMFGYIIFGLDDKSENNKPDVTETEQKIDSLNQVIETLEAIKNGRIEEIKNLNDSATLSLFNELISK